jgi:hypothetical protein
MGRCRAIGKCPKRKDEVYTFETIGEGLFDWVERSDKEWSKKRKVDREERKVVSHAVRGQVLRI